MSMIARMLASAAVAALLAVAAGTADAQTFSAASGQKFHIDLDTVDGHFSDWTHKDIGALSAMRGVVLITRLGADKKWTPYFTVRVSTSSPQMMTAGLRLRKAEKGAAVSLDAYYRNAENKDVVVKRFSKTLSIDQEATVELAWNGRTLSVGVDGEKAAIGLPAAVTQVSISSSSGEIVANVELGSVR